MSLITFVSILLRFFVVFTMLVTARAGMLWLSSRFPAGRLKNVLFREFDIIPRDERGTH